jgi:hypothetical protein
MGFNSGFKGLNIRTDYAPGRYADTSPSSSAVGHERVELYLYSPYEPYGLYRSLSACTRVHFYSVHQIVVHLSTLIVISCNILPSLSRSYEWFFSPEVCLSETICILTYISDIFAVYFMTLWGTQAASIVWLEVKSDWETTRMEGFVV